MNSKTVRLTHVVQSTLCTEASSSMYVSFVQRQTIENRREKTEWEETYLGHLIAMQSCQSNLPYFPIKMF